MALALNNLKRVDMPLNKETKPNQYPWERYEPPYPPSYGLNSTTTVLLGRMALALNNLKRVDMPLNKETKPNQYPWERYEPPYPPSYGLNSTTTVLLEEWLWH